MKTLPILKNVKHITKLQNLGAEISFEPENEDINPFDQMDKEQAQKVCDNYDRGNMAAWFCAKVTVSFRGIEENDYLGGCSYGTFKDFTSEYKGYYVDMINTCIERINKDIVFANEQTKKFWNIRKAKNLIKDYGMYIVSNNVLQTL